MMVIMMMPLMIMIMPMMMLKIIMMKPMMMPTIMITMVDHDCHCFDEDFLEDDGCEPMKGPRSEPQMMSMHEEHKKIEVCNP